MDKADYRFFVPNGEINFFRIEKKDFIIDKMIKISINFLYNEIAYWFYINLPCDDCIPSSEEYKHNYLLLKKDTTIDGNLILNGSHYKLKGKGSIYTIEKIEYQQIHRIMMNFTFKNIHEQLEQWRSMKQSEEVSVGESLDLS